MRDIALPVSGLPFASTASLMRTSKLRRRALRPLLGRQLRSAEAALCAPGGLPVHGIHRIVVCRPNHRLGNSVLISPLLRELETLYPGAEIDIVSAGNAAQALFSTRFNVRRVLSFPRRIARHPAASVTLMRALHRDTYDLAIDACMSSNLGRLVLNACKARYKVGFPDSQTGLGLQSEYYAGCPQHLAKRSVHLLRTAYADAVSTPFPRLHVGLRAAEIAQARQVLAALSGNTPGYSLESPVLGLFANATGDKCYSEDWWNAFSAVLQTRQPGVCVINVLAEHGTSQLPDSTAPFFSRDLRKLAAVLACMDGFISADCGVMHLASAVGTPTLGLFARDNKAKYAPYGGINSALDTPAGMQGGSAGEIASDWVSRMLAARTVHTRDGEYA